MAEPTGSTRRDFLKRSAAVSTALDAPTIIPAHVLGRDNSPSANEQIIIGLIGLMLDGSMRMLEELRWVRWRYGH